MKRKLVIHAGQSKTATTSIQKFLVGNRPQLLRHGWLYPTTGLQYFAHHPFANPFFLKTQDWIRRLDPGAALASLHAEVASAGATSVLISSEVFYFASKKAELAQYFRDFELHVLLFLRRQDDWIESSYRDDLKSGTIPLMDPVDYFNLPRIRDDALDYEQKLEEWVAELGRDHVQVVPFEPACGGCSVETMFLAALGIDDASDFTPAERANERLNQAALHFLSMMTAKRRVAPKYWPLFEFLAAYSQEYPDAAQYRYIFPPDMRLALLERVRESNARVARRYLGRDDGGLFRAPLPDASDAWERFPGLCQAEAVRIAEAMWDWVAESDREMRETEH
jgi:hypothetical protein